jgi:hypothetical protein
MPSDFCAPPNIRFGLRERRPCCMGLVFEAESLESQR